MKRACFLFTLMITAAACSAKVGEPVSFASACDPGNDGKYLQIPGYIADDGSVFCSNIGSSKVQCGFILIDAPGSKNKIKVDIDEGSGANTVTKLESGYKQSDIKVRDNSGNEIALNKDQVKTSGKLSIVQTVDGSPGVCFMQVDRIDR
ncbi:MAG: hypothetical protein ACJ73D_11395 [Pyrinomonadaceae bacterium]